MGPSACTLKSLTLRTSSPFSCYFTPSHPQRLLARHRPTSRCWRSSRFCPPHCYQASLAGTSSLLRAHLPPCMSLAGCLSLLLQDRPQRSSPSDDTGLPQLGQAPCERSHPQTRNRSDRVLDIALFCRLATPVAPYLVRLRYVPLTSYGFLQTPPLPVTPLPFGLSSPRSGRRLHLAGGRVCPLRWANNE